MAPGLEITPEQAQELLDGLQLLVLMGGVVLAVVVALLLAVLLSMFRRS